MSFKVNKGLNLKWSGGVVSWLGSWVRLIEKTQGESGRTGRQYISACAKQQQQQEEEERHHAAKLLAQATAVPG